MNYTDKLNRVVELQKESLNNLYERVTLLSQVFEDVEWRDKLAYEKNILIDEFKLAEELDRYVADAGFSYLQLRAIHQRFKRSEWESNKLSDLYAQVLYPKNDGPKQVRRSVKVAEYDQVQAENKQLKNEVRKVKRAITSGEALKKENEALKKENGKLKQLLEQLRVVADQM